MSKLFQELGEFNNLVCHALCCRNCYSKCNTVSKFNYLYAWIEIIPYLLHSFLLFILASKCISVYISGTKCPLCLSVKLHWGKKHKKGI